MAEHSFMLHRFGRPVALAALGALVVLAGCRKKAGPDLHSLSLIHALTARGVVQSPLQAAGAVPGETAYPVSSIAMEQPGRGENPLGLKRRVNLGVTDNQILFAPPRSEYLVDLPAGPAGRLDTGLLVIRDANSIAAGGDGFAEAAPVNFHVFLESGGRRKVLLDQALGLPPARESRTIRYVFRSVEVPARDERSALRLVTAGPKGAFAAWQAPAFFVPRPEAVNVVLISIDTLRADHVGAYGYGRPVTPALDALAGESVLFRNVYSTAPWTLPAHMSIMTGLTCVRHRVFYEYDRLASDIPTLAGWMQERGYATHAITGAGFVMSVFGFAKGFDEYSMSQGDLADARLAEAAGREAVDWIDKEGDRPFFLFLHTYQVHAPYKGRENVKDLFLKPGARWRDFDVNRDLGGRRGLFTPLSAAERDNVTALYDAGIRTTDEAMIQPVLDVLRRKGLYDRTMIVVTSDHGEGLYEHQAWDHTHSVYDELLRVPLIIKMPGGAKAGRRLDPVVRLTDIMPTILDVAGVPLDPESIDGRSLLPVISGRERGDRFVQASLAENINGVHIPQRVAVIEAGLKAILNQAYSREHLRFFEPPPLIPAPLEAYDLKVDPGERVNLAADASRAAAIRALLRRAEEIARLVAKPAQADGRIDPELERQLRTLGYIR